MRSVLILPPCHTLYRRHGRHRLLTFTLQQRLKAAANREPPLVHRTFDIGNFGPRTFGISAAAYRAAGGQLSPQEAQALADYEAVHGPAPAPAAVRPAGRAPKRGRAGQAAAAAPPPAPAAAQQVYEVTSEQAAASSLFKHGRLELVLAAEPPYYDALRFREGLAAFAFPSIAAELKRRVSLGVPAGAAGWQPSAAVSWGSCVGF